MIGQVAAVGVFGIAIGAALVPVCSSMAQPCYSTRLDRISIPSGAGDGLSFSADGNTALVGAPFDTNCTGADCTGSVYVFIRTANGWLQQGPKLSPAPHPNGYAIRFGSSTSISADGNIALIGSPYATQHLGEANIFVRSGTTWSLGPSLTPTDASGQGFLGTSVVLSADGNTAIVGAPLDTYDGAYHGAVFLFTRSGGSWAQQGPKILGQGWEFLGSTLALSADGNTALAGGSGGAARVLVRSGTTWTQQGPTLVPPSGGDTGAGIALSADGSTAVLGAFADNNYVGAAYIFVRSGNSWAQQGPKIVPTGGIGQAFFGNSVSLSGDGNAALIGAYYDNNQVGAAYTFVRVSGQWSQHGAKLTPSVGGRFGSNVALSANGETAAIAAPTDNASYFTYNQRVVYVNHAASGANNGRTWANAFNELREALAYAAQLPCVPEVWVAAGTYKATGFAGSRSATFQLQNNLAIYGGFAGTETNLSQRNVAANPTILSGDLNGDDNGDLNKNDNSYHVLVGSGTTASAVLDGFTITGGNANVFPANATLAGGGLLIEGGSPTVRSCTFVGNVGGDGPAVKLQPSSAVFDSCSFDQNHSVATSSNTRAGAVTVAGGSPVFRNCTFTGNVNSPTTNGGGAMAIVGGSNAALIGCTFTRNVSGNIGGAVYVESSQVALMNCRIVGNSAAAGGGGGVYVTSGTGALTNCLIVGNTTISGNGAGIVGYLSTLNLFNCDIVANAAPGSPNGFSGMALASGTTVLTNSIITGNTAPGSLSAQARNIGAGVQPLTANQCLIEGWDATNAGTGTSNLNTIFLRLPSPGPDGIWGTIDDDYGDLHVALNSPAIDSGDSTAVPADTYDINLNGNTTETLPWDLDGHARFYDYALIPNTGVGLPPVDRGCYEFTPPDTSIPGDRRWINPAGGQFATLFNWFPGAPGALDSAVFDIPNSYTTSFAASPSISNKAATISNGAVTFNLSGSTYSLTSAIDSSLVVGNTINQPASLTITNGRVNAVEARIGSTVGSVGTVNVSGSGNATTPSAFLATTEGLCVGCQGTGTLNITGGAHASCLFGFLGEQSGATGQINISGPGSRLDAPFFLAIDNGNVNVSNGGLLTTGTFGTIYLFPNGTISGDGTVQGHVVNFGGISPGNSPGTLTINGNYDQVGTIDNLNNVSGQLIAQAAGTGAGQFDKLVVNGTATLGGGLVVSLMNGYQPSGTDTLQLLSATGGIVHPFDVIFFPALTGPSNQNKYFRALYSGLRGPGGSVNINLGTLPALPQFDDPTSLQNLPNQPSGIAVGDLDGDGLPDVAVTIPDPTNPTTATGVVVIFRNLGGVGTNWQGFAQAASVPVGLNPVAAAIARLKPNTTKNYLLVANSGGSGNGIISIIQNTGGPLGTYSAFMTVATDPEPVGLVAADFNGTNGNTTMVAVTCGGGSGVTTGSLTLLGNTSTSTDISFQRRNLPMPAGHRPTRPLPFNPDQDKDLDLAVVMVSSDGSGSAAVYINGHDPGAPVPQPDLFNTNGAAIVLPVGAGPTQGVAGRLAPNSTANPRGKHEDLITVNTAGNSISVLVNTNPITAQDVVSFAPAVDYHFDATGPANPAPVSPTSAAITDLDNSGTLDLVVVGHSPSGTMRVLKVLRNDSTVSLAGTQVAFAQQPDIQPPGSTPPPGQVPGFLAVVSTDVDGDGHPDLVTLFSNSGRSAPNTLSYVRNAILCRGDFDHNGQATISDIFAFLTAWFAASPQSDTNGDGAITIQDIFDFLAAWFTGC